MPFKRWIKAKFKTIGRIYRRFNADNGMIHAGALSFYFLLSILPMSLLGLSILGYVLGSERAALSAVTTLGKIQRILPAGSIDAKAILEALITGRKFIGGLGIVFLIWFSAGVFYTIEVSVNQIFRTATKRGFFKRTAVVYFFMLVAGGLLVASIAVTVIAAIITDYSIGLFGINPASIPFLWNLFFSLVPPALVMLLFMIIYKVGPTSSVRWAAAFKGALFGAIFWELSRRLFGWYISTLAVYNKLYGALGTLVALIIWVFYSATTFLLGAEYAAIWNERYEKKVLQDKEEKVKEVI